MPKPKKFRKMMSKRAKVPASASTETIADSTKRTTIQRILEFAQVADNPNIGACYDAILGAAGSIVDLSLANRAQASTICDAVHKALLRHLIGNEQEWGLQRTRLGSASGAAIEIDVPEVRKASRFYAQAGVDAIAMVVPGPVPDITDPSGFGMALELWTIVFGHDARELIQRADSKLRTRRTRPAPRSSIEWYGADDRAALKTALTNMFCPALTKAPPFDGATEGLTSDEWDTRPARQKRGFVTLMTHSMLPLKKAVTLIGEGKSMVVGAMAAAEVAMKKGKQGSKPTVHPDGLPHFWFQELRRLGLDDIAVPLVKLR